MSLKAGIVGLPNVGKSTLFNAITKKNILVANYPFATIEPNIGVVTVPDERLEKLEEIYIPEEIKPATFELVDIIKSSIGKYDDKHPAKRTFQAIRIEVNGEIKILEQAIRDMIDVLNSKGRLAIITFHSLEDRIVKNIFNEYIGRCTCPKDLPVCVCGKKEIVKVLTKKPILPSAEELEENSRSRSAKLRVIEKI